MSNPISALRKHAAQMFTRWAQALDPTPAASVAPLPEPIIGQMLIRRRPLHGPLGAEQFAVRFEAHYDRKSCAFVVRGHKYVSNYGPHGVGGFAMYWQEVSSNPPVFAGTGEQVTAKILELEQDMLRGIIGYPPSRYKVDTLIGGYEGNIPHIRRQQAIVPAVTAQPA